MAEKNNIKELTTTKKVTVNGTSLSLNITAEARMIGLKAGDIVEIVLRRILSDSDQQTSDKGDASEQH